MASSIFGKKNANSGGGSAIDQATFALNSMGVSSVSAGDAMMAMLYRTNPQVRSIVDQYKGRDVQDLLRERGIDPTDALRRFRK